MFRIVTTYSGNDRLTWSPKKFGKNVLCFECKSLGFNSSCYH